MLDRYKCKLSFKYGGATGGPWIMALQDLPKAHLLLCLVNKYIACPEAMRHVTFTSSWHGMPFMH